MNDTLEYVISAVGFSAAGFGLGFWGGWVVRGIDRVGTELHELKEERHDDDT